MLSDLHVAFGFLTRLGRGCLCAQEDMGRSVRHFTLVGLVLGILVTVPALFIPGGARATLGALFWVGASVWLTRALHWDGWADLWDAWGSCAEGERFWAILKDSHIGAFGVIGLAAGLGGQVLLSRELLASGLWPALVWAPALGRAAAALAAGLGTAPPASTLGRLFLAGATPAVVTVQCLLAVLAGFALCGPRTVLVACVVAGAGLFAMVRLSRRAGGMNGDFLGAAVIWGELAAMFAAALFIA
ncbi:adenosylcobinamide-GDP ribazoletransferase [Desulfovibrio psychrotolerans]|uniref:Adenosylcobinamide-GDP ribazoletransferase n=1 Tax=Desulfovibrio psychrotolerans TaxID=415242 RepID=A0A7J0BTQ5_9BACT|nr:adenosylcobinamide-GDP ribazoletransferase [Desulfovibrio psychrotolerans]GFM37100.1 adenosylcobinamide-GDP ribazoletransferase [Desulfovibrio psychrotolerans]